MIDFLIQGSGVLIAIFASSVLMWFLIADRYWYLFFKKKDFIRNMTQHWSVISPGKTDWQRLAIRHCYLSEFKHKINANISVIKACISISMLLGLLGTIVGMITVFENMVLAEMTGIRGLVNGVAQTIIPAIAGLLVSLSGIYFVAQIQKMARKELSKFADCLPLTHSTETRV